MALTLVTPPQVAVSGTTVSGSAVVTVPSTAALSGALTVSGTGVPAGALVLSIDSATTLTMSANATADGTNTLTFGIEALTLAEAKKHLKIDADLTEDDDLVAALITAARRKCETETWRCFLTSTWDYTLGEFPWGVGYLDSRATQIRIPNPPLVSVTSVTYLDSVGGSQTYPSPSYAVTSTTPGIITPAYGTTWPYVGRNQPNGVVIRYVAGYGLASAVPATVKAAIKLVLAALYVNRGDASFELPEAVCALLACEQWGAIA